VIVAFLIIQQIEGHILAPLIMGSRFRVHPLLVIFAILAGNELHGVTGMFLAIPLIPLAKETISFFSSRVVFKRWRDGPDPLELAGTRESEPAEPSASEHGERHAGTSPPESTR